MTTLIVDPPHFPCSEKKEGMYAFNVVLLPLTVCWFAEWFDLNQIVFKRNISFAHNFDASDNNNIYLDWGGALNGFWFCVLFHIW